MNRTCGVLVLSLALAAGAFACTGDQGGGDDVLPGVEALVFVKRAFINPDGSHELGGMGNVFDYLRYVPGGGVYVLSPPTPAGELRNLTESFEGVDISGLDVSFDAQQVVFSMRHSGDDHYHIWIANIDGSGLRQLTFGTPDDVMPAYLPGDRIVFGTNEAYTEMGLRNDEYNRGPASQLATITIAGGDADRRVCAQNLSHGGTNAFLMSDGRVGFSRWEHLEEVNDLKLMAMNPDCSNVMAVAGQFGKPFNSYVDVSELEPGVFVGIGTSREGTFQAGALVRADARSQTAAADENRLDVQQVSWDILTPEVPTGMESPPSGVGRYRDPRTLRPMIDTDALIVSWADGDVNERLELTQTAPNFGIYLWDPETHERTLIYDDPNTWDVYAVPVTVRRDIPPIRGDFRSDAYDLDTPATLGSIDVGVTSLDETVSGGTLDGMSLDAALDQAHRVRVIEGFSAEIGPVNMFGLTMAEGAAIMGEALVQADGSWEAQVNSYLPYHLQALDEFGMAIRNQTLWIQAMPGEERRCGGCHESRSEDILPAAGPTTLAQQAGAEDFMRAISDRMELPWHDATTNTIGWDGVAQVPHQTIQDLFDAKCVSCHSGGAGDPFAGMTYMVNVETEDGTMLTYTIPFLDLSSRPLEVFYDMEIVSYAASYVTLLYPSAMMMDEVMVTGAMPPIWAIPSDARNSRLISKVNINSELDPAQWAFSGDMPHPEDVGVDLTREERLMLIRVLDLGAQYYNRRNVSGASAY
jgi:hypothetical protein